MLKVLKYALVIIVILLITSLCLIFFTSNNKNWIKNADVDLSVYRPYVLNTEINFNHKGNSKKYIKQEDGWGGQEKEYRINRGKESKIKLYIKDGKNKDILLNMHSFGLFDQNKYKFQTITLTANDTEIQKWEINYESNNYSATIPASVMKDNTLVLTFLIKDPYIYVSENDSIPIGIAIKKMVLKNYSTSETKKKVAKWLKNKLSKLK